MNQRRTTSRVLSAVIGLQTLAIAGLLLSFQPIEEAPTADAAAAVPAKPSASLSAAPAAAAPATQPTNQPAAARGPADPPPAGTLLYGTLRDDQGEPLTSGVVWFARPNTPRPIATVSLGRGVSEFALPGLEPGEVTYRTRSDGRKEVNGRVEIVAGTPRLRHDIVVPASWQLQVRIDTPQGKPLSAELAALAATRRGLQQVAVSAIATLTAPQGDFPPTALRDTGYGIGRWRGATGIEAMLREGQRAPEGVAGVLELDVRQQVWVSAVLRHRVLATAAVEPGQSEVRLQVGVEQVLGDLGAIRGRVVDAATGAPVVDTSVGFNDRQSSSVATKSDAEGRFEVRDLRPGLLTVEVRSAMQMAHPDLVTLAPGETLELGDLPVFTLRKIEGRCENVQGKPESARVTYMSLDPPPHPALRHGRDGPTLAADGSFTLHLPDGRYHLWVMGAGAAMQDIDTRALGATPLVLRLAAEAQLRLAAASGDAVWEVEVYGGERLLTRRTLTGGVPIPLPMPVGTYRVAIVGPRGERRARSIEIGPAGLDLRVPFD